MNNESGFDPNAWAKRFHANAEKGEANAMMDSGWSARAAEECVQTTAALLLELFAELKDVTVDPADFFDRPQLAAVLCAVHESERLSR